jgi:CheY-like chemotaxis protein
MPTALIVEDEPEANHLLSLLVQLRGYRTASALTGQEALDRLGEHRPDVVFLDLMLPDADGFEVCRAIKSRPETSLLPVVVVTARLAEESRDRSYQLGAHAFIAKPYTPEQIFDALASADAWNRELAQRGDSGEIRLDVADEDFARGLARFRALLLARTPLGPQSSAQIVSTLKAIRDDARDFARGRNLDHVATISYTLREDRLVLAIRDEAGWFSGGSLGEAAAKLEPELQQVFDEAGTTDSGREAILTKHFTPPATT